MQKDKKIANDLNYDGIKFPVSETFFVNLKQKTTFVPKFFIMQIN